MPAKRKSKRPSVLSLTTGDKYKPVTREDVSDLNLLPKRFDHFVAETRQSFELLGEKLLAPLLVIKDAVADLVLRAGETDKRMAAVESAQVDHERRLAALESIKPQPRRNLSRKKTRQ